MGELRDQMRADLTIGNYSRGTVKLYLMHVRRFAAYFMRSPAEMGSAEIREYLLWLAEQCRLSPSTMRIARASLRFLYEVTLRRPTEVVWIPWKFRKKWPADSEKDGRSCGHFVGC